MPVNIHKDFRIKHSGNFFWHFISDPHSVELFILLRVQVQGIASLQSLVSLPILIKVRSRQEGAPGHLAVDHNDALSDPQEDAHVSPTCPGVSSAAPALATLYQSLAAMALGADQSSAHQTQGRGLALPGHTVDTGEVARQVHEVSVVPG